MTTITKENFVFEFSEDNQEIIADIFKRYPPDYKQSALLPLLHLAQHQCGGWLPRAAIQVVADLVAIPLLKALEVASFYSMFNLQPVGKYRLQVCTTTPCWLRGSDELLKFCINHLNIQPGQTTAENPQFTLTEVECLGACIRAPIVQINDTFYENMDPGKMLTLLRELTNGEKINENKEVEKHIKNRA